MKIRRIKGPVLVLALALLASGCGKKNTISDEKETAQKDPDAWRNRVVALEVRGYDFQWDETPEAVWHGTGVIVAPGIMVTNAHVVTRAQMITGQDDRGRELTFDRILAVDTKDDLAVVAVGQAEVGADIDLTSMPEDPTSLRQQAVVAAGYTGGPGIAGTGRISLYEGNVNAISGGEGVPERILHDANISSGSSGGPLFNADKTEILGVNHAIHRDLKFSVAIPAWKVSDLLTATKGRKGVPIPEFFTALQDVEYDTIYDNTVCLEAGEMAHFPVEMLQGDDILFVFETEHDAPMVLGLVDGEGTVIKEEVIDGSVLRGLTSQEYGWVGVVIANHPDLASSERCAKFGVARLNWDARGSEPIAAKAQAPKEVAAVTPEFSTAKLKTVALTPIYGASRRAEEAHQFTLAMARNNQNLLVDDTKLPAAGGEGFGFAGAAGAKDLLALRVGDAIGAGLVRPHGEPVREQLRTAIGALEIDDKARESLLVAVDSRLSAIGVFHELMRRMGHGDEENQRTLGYLVAGAWARLAKIHSDNKLNFPGSNFVFISLAEMIEKDALFGGADEKLGGALRLIAEGLKGVAPDEAKIKQGYEMTLLLTPDEI